MKQTTLWDASASLQPPKTEPEHPASIRAPRHGCAIGWARTRAKCPECGFMADWRPGREGRVWMRRHYATNGRTMKWCAEVFTPAQLDLAALDADLETMPAGCQALASVSQRIKRTRGF